MAAFTYCNFSLNDFGRWGWLILNAGMNHLSKKTPIRIKTNFVPTLLVFLKSAEWGKYLGGEDEWVEDVCALLVASVCLPGQQSCYRDGVFSTGKMLKAVAAFQGLAIWAEKGQCWASMGPDMKQCCGTLPLGHRAHASSLPFSATYELSIWMVSKLFSCTWGSTF